MKFVFISALFFLSALVLPAEAAHKKLPLPAKQLDSIRKQVADLEQSLIEGVHQQESIRTQVRKIKKLQKLQILERDLGRKRLSTLETTLGSLQSRKAALTTQVKTQQEAIRKSLIAIEASNREDFVEKVSTIHLPEREKMEAPRRKVLTLLVDRGIKDIETLRADLADAIQLEGRIQEEKQQLTYLFHDLKEQESILELNRQLQVDYLKKKQNERLSQLENYRKLKRSEAQVEQLIGNFNARMELQKTLEAEKMASTKPQQTLPETMMQSLFARSKGQLPFPISNGKVVSNFGRAFDARSGLYIFKKGIDITSGKLEPVRAISAGKVVYSGKLPEYGQVVIIDHGEHFYSLCAHLGKISKKTSDAVSKGDLVGLTDDLGTPLYFEIRARNVAVNPLQWIYN